MKKLISLFETVTTVNTSNYPNLNFPSGAVKGSNPGGDSINDVLLQDINTAATNAKLKVSVTTAVSGHSDKTKSGNVSRHSSGNAVDIAMINGVTITKQTGDALVAELVKLGYKQSNNEDSDKSILWQVPGHYNHVHVSNTTGSPSTPGSSTENSQTSNGSLLDTFLDAGIKSLGLQKESKVEREINKIKKLLK